MFRSRPHICIYGHAVAMQPVAFLISCTCQLVMYASTLCPNCVITIGPSGPADTAGLRMMLSCLRSLDNHDTQDTLLFVFHCAWNVEERADSIVALGWCRCWRKHGFTCRRTGLSHEQLRHVCLNVSRAS
jgi:hypothetical protein